MSRESVQSGAPWEAIAGYARAVRVGSTVHVSGTTAQGPDGELIGAGDAAAQARRCLEIIAAALEQVGARMEDVVRTRMFVTDISQWRAIAEEHGRVFGDIRPTTAMVEISRLVDPEMLVEIEAVAVVPDPLPDTPARSRITDATPCVFAAGATAYADHLSAALGGVIVHRELGPEDLVTQIQLQLGDSCVIIREASATCPPSQSTVRLQVADAARAFARATVAGMTPASSPSAPSPNGREACARDRAGNR